MYIDGSKELAAELSINGEIDVGENVKEIQALNRVGKNQT